MENLNNIDFNKSGGIVPCIIQDSVSNLVLMLGYMNEEALRKTIAERKVTFFSRTKNRLWTKGETSGNFLHLVDIIPDCDNDTLLVKASPAGPVCHTGSDTCFNEENKNFSLHTLEKIIQERKANPQEGSYTNALLGSGLNKIAQKVGEEAVELIIEAKDNNKTLFTNEAADLLYHFLVLLSVKDCSLNEVVEVLEKRHQR